MFLDYAEINVKAGDGGPGALSFLRESFRPRGGPDGGDGGRGADVILRADSQLTTLMDFRYRQQYKAEPGQKGSGTNCTGRSGDDLVLRVPVGTVIRDVDADEPLGELLEDGQELVVARGGKGGWGNARFATSTNQAPRRADPGEPGEERRIALELKLIADVGLVGEPNAGKSTLLSVVSAARPKIADYPFTTLEPNLGVVALPGHRTFVVADIPGIIEGAHEGKGLGLRFLQHVERTRVLAVLVPLDAAEPQAVYDRLRREVALYSEPLAAKPHVVVLTKRDLLPADDPLPVLHTPEAAGALAVSSAAGTGVDDLKEFLWRFVEKAKAQEDEGVDLAPTEQDLEGEG